MLEGKTIVVTGSASGIGARTAELCARMGAEVVGVDRNEDGPRLAGFIKGDLSSAPGVAAIAAQLPGQIDALCNVAGLSGAPGAAPSDRGQFLRAEGAERSRGSAHPAGRCGDQRRLDHAGYGWRANPGKRAKAMVAVAGVPRRRGGGQATRGRRG